MTRNRRFNPLYDDQTDFKTNSPSYYQELARKNKLMKELAEKIWEYNETLELSLKEIETVLNNVVNKIGEGFNQEIEQLLILWLEDGTLDHIINDTLMNKKADKTELTDLENRLVKEFTTFKENLTVNINQFKEETNQHISDFETQVDKDIKKAQQETMEDMHIMGASKKNKTTGYYFLADYEQLENETDDQFINRVLGYLPDKQGTLVLEGKKYDLQGTIKLSRYQSLKGTGFATILALESGTADIIKITNDGVNEYTYGVTIKDMRLTGSNINTGIHLGKSTHIQISNVYVMETKWGVWGENVWLATYDRLTIRNYRNEGETGFYIGSGTSNVLNSVWTKKFKKGFDMGTSYSTLNSCACDDFTQYAYLMRQNTVLNGCGAENGTIVAGGWVFGAGARGVTFNSCETLGIESAGSVGTVPYFHLNGTMATINSFRNHGSYVDGKLNFMHLDGACHVNIMGVQIQDYNEYYVFKESGTGSVVLERSQKALTFHRWNKTVVVGEV